jgi:hypothetical protein
VNRDKTKYTSLKDDKYFLVESWIFVATAFGFRQKLRPSNSQQYHSFLRDSNVHVCCLEEHLTTVTGKSLVSQFKLDQDARIIYHELKKHAVHKAGLFIVTIYYRCPLPGNWHGSSYASVLHWKKQFAQYKKLELESFPRQTDWLSRCCPW